MPDRSLALTCKYTYMDDMADDLLSAREFQAQCLCLGAQRAARALARRYDAALRPVGLTSGQFAILAALNRPAPAPLTELADQLGLERTTLTRNLQPLERAGLLVAAAPGQDRRVRAVALTQLGRDKLGAAMPAWRSVQEESLAAVAPATLPVVRHGLAALTAA